MLRGIKIGRKAIDDEYNCIHNSNMSIPLGKMEVGLRRIVNKNALRGEL